MGLYAAAPLREATEGIYTVVQERREREDEIRKAAEVQELIDSRESSFREFKSDAVRKKGCLKRELRELSRQAAKKKAALSALEAALAEEGEAVQRDLCRLRDRPEFRERDRVNSLVKRRAQLDGELNKVRKAVGGGRFDPTDVQCPVCLCVPTEVFACLECDNLVCQSCRQDPRVRGGPVAAAITCRLQIYGNLLGDVFR